MVYEFYNQRRRQVISDEIQPNLAHIALAEFERKHKGFILLVTQNIDDLHERAGSKNIRHMHGELLKMRCIHTNLIFDTKYDFDAQTSCECCQQPGNLRPHVVWFGEMPLYMEEIHSALASCDFFIAIGTSGNVYPAAGFYQTAKRAGEQTVELNLEPTESAFDENIQGKATKIVPQYFKELLSK